MDNTGLSNFIELYKQKTCLWDSSCRDYTNRNARRAALEELLQIYKRYDKTANIASVRKKIDTLRTNYNRELKKVRASETTGSSPDYVYQPSLWYYQQLDFLSETHDVARGGRGSAGETEEGITEESTETAKSDVTELGPPPAKKLKKGAERLTKHKKIINLAEKLAVPKVITLDEFESFGNTVGLALMKLNEQQQAISQKLISEIIFLAKMNRLTENASIVCNQFVPLTSPLQAGMDLSSPSV